MSFIKNLIYKVDDFELSIPSLEIPDEGVTALQGPSGSGKTTLLNIMVGIEIPQSWEWNFKGEKMHELEISQRRLGVVFQSYDLFPHMTAEENILIVLHARVADDRLAAAKERLERYKSKLDLQKCWTTKAANLSGGEKQRVALLRAVMSEPRMLLLDEPFSALDANLRDESRRSLKEFLDSVSVPVFLITHDKADVDALASKLIRIEAGKIV